MKPTPIVYERRDRLPRLAWCAHVGRAATRVVHGPWVECRPEGFVEGVWDGPFGDFDFDCAPNLFGSGARLRDSRLIFCTATHPLDRLYVIERESEILVSHSLPFILSEADDAPDLSHPNYFFKILDHFREGVSEGTHSIPTAKGENVRLFAVCNIEVSADGAVSASAKGLGPEPRDYEHYRSLLDGAVRRLFANAADDGRTHQFQPIAAVSRGYDSVAAAAVATQAGCRNALTFQQSNSSRGWIDDDGGSICEALGLAMESADRSAFHALPVDRQAEWFLSTVGNGENGLGTCEHLLEERVLVTGRRGETTWGTERQTRGSRLGNRGNVIMTGPDSIEQRLHCGYVQLHVPMIAARHGEALYRINSAAETDAWTADGAAYQRPAARRIAEEAGVPRQAFGMRKAGGAGKLAPLGPEAMEAFLAFYREHVPKPIRRGLRESHSDRRRKAHVYLRRLWMRFADHPIFDPLLDASGWRRMHLLWKMRDLYQFHWGLLRTMDRYRD